MDATVTLFQEAADEMPHVAVSSGVDTLTFPWPVWEQLVHRASHQYVSWALRHPSEYVRLEQHMASLGGPGLVAARYHALTD